MSISFEFGCVYFFKSIENDLLYIGKTYNLRNRLNQHLADPVEWKTSIYYVEYMVIENEVDRDIIETYCINLYKPIYNRDKVFDSVRPTIHIDLPNKEIVLKTEIVKTINKRSEIKTFKKCCILYHAQVENREDITAAYPLVKEAYDVLGFEKLEKAKFNITNIRRKLLTIKGEKFFNKEDKYKVRQILDTYPEIEIGVFISSKKLKEIFNNIYLELEIKKTAKSTDLLEFYDYQEKSKRLHGIVTKGYIPLCRKIDKVI